MALLQDLINKIDDLTLRQQIMAEVNKLAKQKKFGLVFEEHLPECTPLYNVKIRKDSKVALKAGQVSDIYIVHSIDGDKAICEHVTDHAETEFALDELVAVAEFGESIYPYLEPVDSVCNAPNSEIWHTLIEADNYHALQLLEYLYAGKVDCIYIDPPYNTGAKDWKYNNDYVDGNDQYRHSKWLSMMEKRLRLAQKLLKSTGVLICAIDDNELNSLGLLLNEIFKYQTITPITVVHNPSGTQGKNFSFNNEFLYFVYNQSIVSIYPEKRSDECADIRPFINGAKGKTENYLRATGATTFYPIIVDKNNHISFGDVCEDSFHPKSRVEVIDNKYYIYPIDGDNIERKWLFSRDTVESIKDELFVKTDNSGLPVIYRKKNRINRKTVWTAVEYNAKQYGSVLLKNIINRNFPFPKSLYSVEEAIKSCTEFKKDALIVDFFAGSGTTLHAVNLLNAEDGGRRRCILVTNNEVSEAEAKSLADQGYKPGDKEWEKLGIARFVTWPRTICSIKGRDVNGEPLKGNYLGSDIPMADGFKSNAAFFKLGFLDKSSVRVGRQFREMLPTLWMKAGCYGACPTLAGRKLPEYLVLPENRMAILNDSSCFMHFAEEVGNEPEIETVYLVTDSDSDYRSMSNELKAKQTYQLYRDYLDNFRINSKR